MRAVESDPYRYGLELDEVERRRQLVEEVGNEVEDMRAELLKTVHDARKKGKSAGLAKGTDALPDPSSFDGDDEYTAFEQERQMEIMHEQDEALDGVFKTVGNLRQQADDMGRELEEQGEILNDVDNVADRVGGKLQDGIKKVGWVLKKNEGMSKQFNRLIFITHDSFPRYLVELLHRYPDIRTHLAAYSHTRSLSRIV